MAFGEKENEERLKATVDRTYAMGTSRPMNEEEILSRLFTYHPARPDQVPRYTAIRSAAKHLGEMIMQNVPPGADRTAAIRHLREAVMTANAGIALDGFSL